MACHNWLVIPSHQKHSCNRERVWSRPWYPASLWHPSGQQLDVPLGLQKAEDFHSHPWAWSRGIGLSDEVWNSADSARSVCPTHWRHALLTASLNPLSFALPTSLKSTLNTGSSFWALAQSVTCICTSTWLVATCTSCSKPWSPSINGGVVNLHLMCSSQGYSIQDQSHHVLVEVGSNPAQYLQSVIASFLVLLLEVEPHKGSDPLVASVIRVRCHHDIS